MRSRSVTYHTLLGGSLGGLLGILLFHFIAPGWLPVGCFIGWILGCRPRELYRGLRAACLETVVLTGSIWMKITEQKKPHRKIDRPVSSARKALRLYRLAFLTFGGIIGMMFIVAVPVIVNLTMSGIHWPILLLSFGPLYAICTLASMLAPMMLKYSRDTEHLDRKNIVRRLRRQYSQQGAKMFYRRNLGHLFGCLVIQVMASVGFFVWGTTAAITLIFLVGIPLFACVFVAKAIIQITLQRGYWLCLLVTFCTTLASALLMGSTFGNPTMLWLTAFGTGIASALLSEAVAAGFEYVLTHTTKLQNFASYPWMQSLKLRWNFALDEAPTNYLGRLFKLV